MKHFSIKSKRGLFSFYCVAKDDTLYVQYNSRIPISIGTLRIEISNGTNPNVLAQEMADIMDRKVTDQEIEKYFNSLTNGFVKAINSLAYDEDKYPSTGSMLYH